MNISQSQYAALYSGKLIVTANLTAVAIDAAEQSLHYRQTIFNLIINKIEYKIMDGFEKKRFSNLY